MADQLDRFVEHARELHQKKYVGRGLSEADTRSYLIDPVLRLLGYSGIDRLRREVPVVETKEFVDYQLLLDDKAKVIVEAKSLRSALSDKHAGQCVQYASVLGVRWCFITNGVEWHLYDAYAKGPLNQKKISTVRLDGDDESIRRAWSVLSCFSAEELRRSHSMTALLVERVLADELHDSASPSVKALIRSVRSRFGERVSGEMVVAAVRHLYAPTAGSLAAGSPANPLPRGDDDVGPLRPSSRRRATIADLTAGGLLPDGASIEVRVDGIVHSARIRDGAIESDGRRRKTPSAASGSSECRELEWLGGLAISGRVSLPAEGPTRLGGPSDKRVASRRCSASGVNPSCRERQGEMSLATSSMFSAILN